MSSATLYPIEAETTAANDVGPTVSTIRLPGPPAGMPASVARGQLYYWTEKWQAEEAVSVAEIDGGSGRRFESATDAIRWLLSDDD